MGGGGKGGAARAAELFACGRRDRFHSASAASPSMRRHGLRVFQSPSFALEAGVLERYRRVTASITSGCLRHRPWWRGAV